MIFKGKQLNTRISIVIFIFSLLWGLLFVRSAYLQLVPNKKLSRLQNKLFERTVTLKPRRGMIYDRYGKELAISIPSQSLFADPQRMEEVYYSAKKLSQLLNLPYKKTLKKLLNKKRRFVWLKRHLSESEVQKIKSWKLSGLYFIKERKRFYTRKSSLSQVLGFTGVEGQGLEGIEKQYDEILRGESQKVLIQRDAKGRPLFMDFTPFISKVSGFDVYLTIDSDLQFYLEKALERAVSDSKAEAAMAVILSAGSSEILAMANVPNYNPNQLGESQPAHRRNRAVTDIFEPGSTLKTFTLISALEKGIKPTQIYSSHEGSLSVGRSVIREADPKKKFKAFLNMSEILALSSNVGAASIALEVGPEALRKIFWRFGFGRKTGVDFPGEAKGLLRELPWRPVETATVGFGHGVAVTALQVANAYSAIANGGLLKKPFLVKQIRNPYTGEEKHFKGQILRRVLTPEEVRTLSLMLISVTEEGGTGFKANVPGYFVAGKTGTAQKVDFENKGYKKGEYISSFAGFIPAHKPAFVIYLMVDGAKDNFYASSLVAPLFSQVASYSVRNAGLSPTVLQESSIVLASKSAELSPQQIKSQKSYGKAKSSSVISQNGDKRNSISSVKISNSETIKDGSQNLERLDQFSSDEKIKREVAFVKDFIPDLQGLSLRETLNELQSLGLQFKIQGSGRLVHTVPLAGESVPGDKTITLIFN